MALTTNGAGILVAVLGVSFTKPQVEQPAP
jgi:hypothetical protein